MLAQRWEQPSTAQEERNAITRARRLCKRKRKPIAAKFRAQKSKVSQSSIFEVESDFDSNAISNTFLAITRMIGINPYVQFENAELSSRHLGTSISFLEGILGFIRHRIALCHEPFSSAAPNEDQLTLSILWDPSTMKRISANCSPNFCRHIAKMSREEFCSRMEACDLPLPCPKTEFLGYLVDGSVCIGENITSWTRFSTAI